MGRHVMEALGMSRVVMEDGKVIEVSEPKVKYCPLFKRLRNIDEITADIVRDNMEFRMRDFGMCTENRVTRMDYVLSFGISELLSLACRNKYLDAAVIAADGCGTAVISDPDIIQGMGGRISAIIETSPVAKVIADIGADRILDPKTARIDQKAGVEKAFSMGFGRIGVTTPFAEEAEYYRTKYGNRVMIFGVHTTCVTEEQADIFFENADVITACASKYIRARAKDKAMLQAGTKVPIYAATESGAELMRMKLRELGKEPDNVDTDCPEPLL